jgi:dihydroorotate dehydrogenase electron transfer subunit
MKMLKPVKARITETQQYTSWAYLLWLAAREVAAAAEPGQFLMVDCGGDTFLRRPLGIHRVDAAREKFALLVAPAGKGTSRLVQRQPGEIMAILGPLGNGFSVAPDARNILLVSGGIGIAPLYFLAQEARNRGVAVTTIHGTPKANHYPREYWLPDAAFVIATEDGSAGQQGLATDLLPEYAARADQVFACGPPPMYRTMAAMPELKDKPVQVSLEMRMACGTGLCYGCTVKTRQGPKQVCRDGPVFDLKDIIWDELFSGDKV